MSGQKRIPAVHITPKRQQADLAQDERLYAGSPSDRDIPLAVSTDTEHVHAAVPGRTSGSLARHHPPVVQQRPEKVPCVGGAVSYTGVPQKNGARFIGHLNQTPTDGRWYFRNMYGYVC